MMKKMLFCLYLAFNVFLWIPPAQAEYPVSFAEMLISLLKEKKQQEKKLGFYGQANAEMKKLIKETIGTKGTLFLHKENDRIISKKDDKKFKELKNARSFLNFQTSITEDFVQGKVGKADLVLEDFISFVEERFFLDNEKKGADKNDVLLDELTQLQKDREKFLDETLKEAYVYAFLHRGFSISSASQEAGTDKPKNKQDFINELKTQSDNDKTLREALYTNNRALQELIFETMQMIMFEQVALEIEAAEQLQATVIPLLKYDYNLSEDEETEEKTE